MWAVVVFILILIGIPLFILWGTSVIRPNDPRTTGLSPRSVWGVWWPWTRSGGIGMSDEPVSSTDPLYMNLDELGRKIKKSRD